jgi:hypothetical protein
LADGADNRPDDRHGDLAQVKALVLKPATTHG